jgi:NarL family two-component system sensor histidine kinase YdfH
MMERTRALLQSEEGAEARPFYVITTVLLLAVTALTLFQPPSPMPTRRLPLFVALLALHLLLHWLSGRAVAHERRRLLYLPLQGGLALALALISQRPELALAMFAALVAETLGLLGLTGPAVAAVAGYLSLMGISFYALGGWALIAAWAEPVISTMALLILFMVLYRRQTEARAQSQELLGELEKAHGELAAYAAQVEDLTLAAERQRMARELHDTLAQGVAGMVLQLEAAKAHLDKGRPERAEEIVAQCMRRARSTLADSRAAIDDLRLEERSLAEAVQGHAERFTRATGIPCHLTLELAAEGSLPEDVKNHAERIVGESLTNIMRHAQADQVWLTVRQGEEALAIEVRDDGRGFDVEKATRAGHYGLLGMRERVRLVKGMFELKSEDGQGSRLTVSLPLEAI